MKAIKWGLFFGSLLVVLGGCKRTVGEASNTPTGGRMVIAVDESLKPIVEAEVQAFEAIYPQAEISLRYVSESEAAELLLRDSVRLAILCRKLDSREEGLIRKAKIHPTATRIASDAVALIVHPDNPDTLISYDQLQAILQGKLRQWQELGGDTSSVEGEIQLVFDHAGSSTLRVLKDSLRLTVHQQNFFALKDNQGVIDYVAQNRQAIGVIGLSWVSDSDDRAAQFSLQKIKVMAVASHQSQEYFAPYQAHLAQGDYPLVREVFVVSREARAGLGSGFIAFLGNEKGQRIILKSGLLPATMPTRQVLLSAEQILLNE